MEKIEKEKVLVSLCFTGEPCRYHGRSVPSPAKIKRLSERYLLIYACPEQLGGLPVPRPAAPLRNKNGDKLRDINGKDVSREFITGAKKTLQICLEHGIERAFLCKGSPSCDKRGFAGELLLKHGIKVINL